MACRRLAAAVIGSPLAPGLAPPEDRQPRLGRLAGGRADPQAPVSAWRRRSRSPIARSIGRFAITPLLIFSIKAPVKMTG